MVSNLCIRCGKRLESSSADNVCWKCSQEIRHPCPRCKEKDAQIADLQRQLEDARGAIRELFTEGWIDEACDSTVLTEQSSDAIKVAIDALLAKDNDQ